MKRKHYAMLFLPLIVLLTACEPAITTVIVTATPTPTSTPEPGVTLYYEGNAQFELISSAGTRVLIDVYDPDLLSSPATAADVVLTTHRHGDHFNSAFLSSFPGQQIMFREDELDLPDVTIKSIASAHSPNEIPVPEGGSNYIFIIDMGGLRFAHLGDIGQEELSQEQLGALGKVDVVMTQLGGGCSQSEDHNFNVVEQANPRLIIPTHTAVTALERAFEMWESYYANPWVSASDIERVTISSANLSDETKFLILGEWAYTCRDYDLPQWQ